MALSGQDTAFLRDRSAPATRSRRLHVRSTPGKPRRCSPTSLNPGPRSQPARLTASRSRRIGRRKSGSARRKPGRARRVAGRVGASISESDLKNICVSDDEKLDRRRQQPCAVVLQFGGQAARGDRPEGHRRHLHSRRRGHHRRRTRRSPIPTSSRPSRYSANGRRVWLHDVRRAATAQPRRLTASSSPRPPTHRHRDRRRHRQQRPQPERSPANRSSVTTVRSSPPTARAPAVAAVGGTDGLASVNDHLRDHQRSTDR